MNGCAREHGVFVGGLEVPEGPEEVTPYWLTQALRSEGTISLSTVVSSNSELLGVGQSFLGRVVRLTLRYDIDEPGAPASLVAKFPSADPNIRIPISQQGLYEREIRFYRDVAEKINLRTPQLYYASANARMYRYVLLLEDLSPAQVGDDVAGCSYEDAGLAIRSLAEFHASMWAEPSLLTMDWLAPSGNEGARHQELYQQRWEIFIQRLGDRLPSTFLTLGKIFADHVAFVRDRMSEPPLTMVHGDFRLDNLFFSTDDGRRSFAVADWQIVSRGRGVADVSMFLVSCFAPEFRRAVEFDILRTYHSVLLENGVEGYDFEECLYDYRFSVLQHLFRCVVGGGHLDFSSDRGNAYISALLQRTNAAMIDHKVIDFLPRG